uniref:FLZ-type domain-containing protein n=1 Tax=Oryza punctata TaxID=4537 RepID=A0A0E0KEU3_ORYPU
MVEKASAVARKLDVSVGRCSPWQQQQQEYGSGGLAGRCATSLCGSGAGAAAFRVAEFLACCDLCRRPLDGKDIFMYRGERAFCSMECRYHAIVSDEFQQEKERKRRAAAAPRDIPSKVSAASTAAAEIAGSPCSGGGQIFFTTGIVAA